MRVPDTAPVWGAADCMLGLGAVACGLGASCGITPGGGGEGVAAGGCPPVGGPLCAIASDVPPTPFVLVFLDLCVLPFADMYMLLRCLVGLIVFCAMRVPDTAPVWGAADCMLGLGAVACGLGASCGITPGGGGEGVAAGGCPPVGGPVCA